MLNDKKKNYFTLLYFLIINLIVLGQQHEKNRVLLEYTNFATTTTITTSCTSFNNQFVGDINVRNIVSNDTIKTIKHYLKEVEYSNECVDNINVRAKLYVRSDKKQHVICFDTFYIMVDGRLVKTNDQFRKYLFSMIPDEYLLPPFRHK